MTEHTKELSASVMASVKSSFDSSKMEMIRDNTIRDGRQRDTDRNNFIRDAKQLDMEKQLKLLQANMGSNASLSFEVFSLK